LWKTAKEKNEWKSQEEKIVMRTHIVAKKVLIYVLAFHQSI